MFDNLFISIFFIFYLISVNYILKKFKLSLDTATKTEKHKLLLREKNLTPLSGTYFFLPIIILTFYNLDFLALICCTFLFLLGLGADLKVISSYKLRLVFQFLFLSGLFYSSNDLFIDTRILVLNDLMNYNLVRVLLCTFFFMVLINGFNLIDGTNCLCALNIFIITIFIYLVLNRLNVEYFNYEILLLAISLLTFLIFNFFGKNFLGDGATYGLGFLSGYLLLNLSLLEHKISPYFVANLLWYPAFENLFSIIRRNISKKNNYLPDNDHLHHLIFKFFEKKILKKNKFLLSSFIGILLNSFLLLGYLIGYYYYNYTYVQVLTIFSGIFFYLITYYLLKKNFS